MARKFPKDFLWGAGTAAHQVEGDTNNQWTVWEQENAERLAAQGGTDIPDWFPGADALHAQAKDPANYISGAGVKHYQLYEHDFDLLKKLNMNTFRFSVEWSRVEPKPGKWDRKEIDHYKQYVSALEKRNIIPIVTLWHWTMPLWFTDLGAFEHRKNIKYFVRYAEKIAAELGVERIVILNEPNSYASLSYQQGMWPPQGKNPALAFKVYWHLALAHKASYKAIKESLPNIKIGIAANLIDAQPASPHNPANLALVWFGDYLTNWWFLNRIRNQLDFIGVNYYFTTYHSWRLQLKNPPKPVSDMGWYMEPASIYRILTKTWKRYHKPMIITENGLADEKDNYREWWLKQTIKAIDKALRDGIDLKGYLHWSLIDNFEWAYGWWPRFGLVAVNRKNMRRTIRPSAKWLAAEIKKLS